MVELTRVEQPLQEYITEEHLRNSLAFLRQAAESVWANDAPRIIQDFTDHGIEHSKRLTGFVAKLLEANDGRTLSSQEMYLLLVGIYLHDVGMQCDVTKFPEIKARAEELGARFDVSFTARKASAYSIDEQKAIRKNHQYLTAAWIDYAYRTGNTALGLAAKTIPEDLVADLMDVCKHHAKLPITDCPITFKFDPTQRKQLVAALLRFADELDVDGNRVTIETIENFRLDPHNAVYWWLHNRTKIVFSARNVVLLNIRLHPENVEQYGSFVYNAFITEFQTKNRPVLGVLRQNGIPIAISAESEVVRDDHAELLPTEIVQALQAMQQRHDPLIELADEVATWLRTIRYEVSEPQSLDDRTVQMLVTLDQGTVKQRVMVRCIGGEITVGDVDALDEILDRKTPQGWLISDKRISERARARASGDEAFQIFSLAEFLQQMVWGPYFDALTSLVERASIPHLYVDLGCYKQEMDASGNEIARDRYDSLDAYVDNWLTERGKVHISLLGAFGTGKTWFCHHYAYRQLKRYLDNPVSQRLPILITLRAFTKSLTPQQLINDALLEQYRLPFVGSAFEVFHEMNRRGKLLLILDGFDEMARQVDYQTVVDNFWQLAELVEENSKVILTSRTEYFHWAKESEKILGGEEFGRRVVVLSPPKFEVLHLEPFSDDQIREVITRRLGSEEGPSLAERVLTNEKLAEMARKPVLVELLLAAIDEVSADILENSAQVYLYATNRLLLRNIDTQRTFTTTADKLYFLCELAWEMIKSGELRVHYKDIPVRIKGYFGDRIKDQHELDTWDFDLRNQTLLHRDAAGYYEFAHKSLAEYFVAFKLAAELGCLAGVFRQTYCEADGQPCQIPIERKQINELAETFGAMVLVDQWGALTGMLLGVSAEDAEERLWGIIKETRGKTPEQVKYIGCNAVRMLQWKHESFVGVNLAHTVLTGASLYSTDLTGANLQSACLRKVKLINPVLENCDFRLSDLQDATIAEEHSISSLCWSSSGKFLAGNFNGIVKIFDIQDDKEVFGLRIGGAWDRTLQFVPNENRLLFVSGSQLMAAVLRGARWSTEVEIEFEHPIHCIAISDGGALVAVFQRKPSNRIIVCNRQTKEQVRIIEAEYDTYSLSFIPNSDLLVAAHSSGGGGRMWEREWPSVRVWDVVRGCAVWNLERRGGSWSRCNFDTDRVGRTLATGAFDNKLTIWAVPSFVVVRAIQNLGGYSIAYSPDSTTIAMGTHLPGERKKEMKREREGQLNLVDVASGEIRLSIKCDDFLTSLTFSPNGHHIASGGRGGVFIWDVDPKNSACGQCVKGLNVKMNCKGMKISGARGLEQEMTWMTKGIERRGTLLEFLAECGAVLDEEQERVLEEARKRRAS